MRSKPELQQLAEETRAALKQVVRDLEKSELARAEIPSDRWPLTWPDMTAHVNTLKLRASLLRIELDALEKVLKERRPAIVRVYLNDLGLDELEG